VSMSIASLILTGIGSSMVLASRALPNPSNKLSQSIAVNKVLEKISGELSVAQTFTLASMNAVEFTVPDRDADSVPETIRYEWSGILGDPFTRKYNLLPSVTLLENVNKLELVYDVDAVAAGGGNTLTDQPFTQFINMNIDAGAVELSYGITDTTQLSQFITPDPALLPTNTVKWKLDQVSFSVKKDSRPNGVINVELRNDRSNGEPQPFAIESYLLNENTLGMNWSSSTYDFISAPWLNPTQGICLTFTPVLSSDATKCLLLYQQPSIAQTYTKLFTSSDSGNTWVQAVNQTMTGIYVYGTARIDNSLGTPPTARKLNTVTIELQLDKSTNTIHSTLTNILNHPDVSVQ